MKIFLKLLRTFSLILLSIIVFIFIPFVWPLPLIILLCAPQSSLELLHTVGQIKLW